MRNPISRKEFMSFCSRLGLLSFLPLGTIIEPVRSNHHNGDFLKALTCIMDEQGRKWEAPLLEENMDSMRYADMKIGPASHLDWTLVVWAGNRDFATVRSVMEEYVRRRDGKPPISYICPEIDLGRYGRPETCGLCFYHEQIEALLNEVTMLSGCEARRGFVTRMIGKTEFRGLLNEEYSRQFSDEDVNGLYDQVCLFARWSLPYVFCSTMVIKATERVANKT